MKMHFRFLLAILAILPSLAYAQGVRISETTGTPQPSSLLELESSSQGFLPPRLTTAQRAVIPSPVNGLVIFNTDEDCLNLYVNGLWKSLCGCDLPGAFAISGTSAVSSISFTVSWNAAANATGYLLDVSASPDFSNFVQGYQALSTGNVTSYNVTGLVQLTTYYIRLRATNACGTGAYTSSASVTTAATPPFSCGSSSVSIAHNSSDGVSPVTGTIVYGSVTYNSRCWLDKNLGATAIPTSSTSTSDAHAGWYWQFNRLQGYAVGPLPSTWNTSGAGAGNWLPGNDPCTVLAGSNWRIPTSSEWTAANTSWAGYPSAFSSPLKLHASGNLLLGGTGNLSNRGYSGRFWSSEQASDTNGLNLHLGSNGSGIENSNQKFHGFSIRCILNQ
jgi:hypothetical protein